MGFIAFVVFALLFKWADKEAQREADLRESTPGSDTVF